MQRPRSADPAVGRSLSNGMQHSERGGLPMSISTNMGSWGPTDQPQRGGKVLSANRSNMSATTALDNRSDSPRGFFRKQLPADGAQDPGAARPVLSTAASSVATNSHGRGDNGGTGAVAGTFNGGSSMLMLPVAQSSRPDNLHQRQRQRQRQPQPQRRRPSSAGPSSSSPSAFTNVSPTANYQNVRSGSSGGILPSAMNAGASMRGSNGAVSSSSGSLPSFNASNRSRINSGQHQHQTHQRPQKQQLGGIGTATQARSGRFLQHVNV